MQHFVVQARILVAEDDRKQADLVRRYLEREGHSVVVVHDGRAALDAARQRRPDLLVLDVMMPRVDGLDVCRVLRPESDVPIIMLTARSTEDDMLLGLDLGADDYLTKPFSPRELVARVRTCCAGPAGRHRAGDADGPSGSASWRSTPPATRSAWPALRWSARRPSSASWRRWPPRRAGLSPGRSC